MAAHPYDGGALRFGATIDGETINWTDNVIKVALIGKDYAQDRTSVHWDEIVDYEIEPGGE